jgi:SAM-dependent methyltransferase
MDPGAVFRCPLCLGALRQNSQAELSCDSGHAFPIAGGVPRFVPPENYAASFGRQWNHWATTQMDSVNGTTIFRERFSRYFDSPETFQDLRVLDAGCGVGAFIELLAPHAAEVVGFDLSTAVEAAQANVGGLANVAIAQADIFNPPLEPESFDLVYCVGVLQHTPDPQRAFSSLARLVKPGGRLGVWVYERSRFEALKPRHLLRRYTSRLEDERAMRFVDRFAPRALRLRRRLAGLPAASASRKLIPVADVRDYEGDPGAQLTEAQQAEWCLMDTHDMLITRYDQPQKPARVERWFRDNGFDPPRRGDAEAVAMLGVKRLPDGRANGGRASGARRRG